MQQNSTIVAPMTSPGASAAALVRLSGEDARAIAARLFSAPLKARTAVLGTIKNEKGEKLDTALAVLFPAPASYTGEDVVEFSVHGSPVLVDALCRLCISYGARMAGRGEFTRRAFLNGKLDLTAAEGVMELIDARSPAELRAAAAHLGGSVYTEMTSLRATLISVTARLCAYVDYPDDDIGDLPREELVAALSDLSRRAAALRGRAETGRALREGARVCILGRVNVGKSSLMNLLTRADRSIVTDIPGTTRDVVSQTLLLGDLRLELSDTAGVRQTDDPVERIGVERSRAAAADADLVLCVFDSSAPLSDADRELIEGASDERTVAVINKADLPTKIDKEYIASYIKHTVEISALTGEGLTALEETIKGMLFGGAPLDEGLILTLRQGDCLARLDVSCREALDAARAGVTYDAVGVLIDGAVAAAGEMTGESVTEDTVAEIFARFCVGK